MANPPVKSIVLKTPRPTSAQAAAMARAQQPVLPDPRIMDSRRTVNGAGATVGLGNPNPIRVDRNGLVVSPSNSVGALTAGRKAQPTPKPHVKVTVHPSGKIEVTHAPAKSAPAQASSSAAAAAPVAPAASTTPTVKPKAKVAPARVPAAQGTPAAPQQTIEQQAQTILDPVKQSILDVINGRVNAQQTAITNYSKDLAGLMGQYGPASKSAYGGAETGQAAIDAALASTLQGAGASGQADLAAKLAQIDADPGTAARLNGAAAQTTQGAVGAGAARGSASLSSLLAQGANAQDYGAKLPGVAGLYGLQATKSAQSQGTTDTTNAVATLEQQLPNIVQQLKTNGTQQQQVNFERGVALLGANGNVVTPEIRKLLGGALPTGATPKAKAEAAKADAAAAAAAQKQANADREYQLQVQKFGLSEIKLKAQLQKETRTAAAKGTHLGLSAKDWQNYNALALSGARSAHNGTPDGTHPPVSWQQFLTIGLGEKIPISVLIAQGKKVYSQAEIRQGLIPSKGK